MLTWKVKLSIFQPLFCTILTWKVKLSIFQPYFVTILAWKVKLSIFLALFCLLTTRCSFPEFRIRIDVSATSFSFFQMLIFSILLVIERRFYLSFYQCCGSMTFWPGSGSADPCLWRMDPDPVIFVIGLQGAYKKLILVFLLISFLGYIYKKKSQNSPNEGFTYFFWVIEGSRSIPLTHPDPGGPKTYGSATLLLIR